MKTTRALKYPLRILFFACVFFTEICFVDTWHMPFFLNSKYKALKIILCVVLPLLSSILCYLCEKDFKYIGRASAVIMSLFAVFYLIDQLTVKYIAHHGDFVVIFHLCYALISGFSVFAACTIIKIFTKNKNNGYAAFYNDFFIGFGIMFVFIFIMIYFVLRDYSGTAGYTLNLKPFSGELKAFTSVQLLKMKSKYFIIRSIGNVLFYTAMAPLAARFVKKHKCIAAILIPFCISILSETFQFIFSCGDADIDDVILNTAGAAIGALLYKFIINPLLNTESLKKQ